MKKKLLITGGVISMVVLAAALWQERSGESHGDTNGLDKLEARRNPGTSMQFDSGSQGYPSSGESDEVAGMAIATPVSTANAYRDIPDVQQRMRAGLAGARKRMGSGDHSEAGKILKEVFKDMSNDNAAGETSVGPDGVVEVQLNQQLFGAAASAFDELARSAPEEASALANDGEIEQEIQDFLGDEFGKTASALLQENPQQFRDYFNSLDNDTQEFVAWELAEELVQSNQVESAMANWEDIREEVAFDMDHAVSIVSVMGRHSPGS